MSRLLSSIAQNSILDDIEVIISDDCSTENFDDVIEQFRKKFTIKFIKNDKHYGFPRAGRQNGADNATGKWMCFADQDDSFIENAFDDVRKYIVNNDIHNCLFSNFYEESVEMNRKVIRSSFSGWTHGKFYELAFWKKYDISYDELDYCEDINLSAKIDCIMCAERIKPNTYDKTVYIWRRRSDSLADTTYFANSMPDYIDATLSIVIRYLEKYKDDEALFMTFNIKFISNMMNIYFNFQSNLLYEKKKILLETMARFQPIFTRYKEITGFTTSDIIYYIYNELTDLYLQVRNDNYSQVPFVEKESIRDWILLYLE